MLSVADIGKCMFCKEKEHFSGDCWVQIKIEVALCRFKKEEKGVRRERAH